MTQFTIVINYSDTVSAECISNITASQKCHHRSVGTNRKVEFFFIMLDHNGSYLPCTVGNK